MSKPPPAPPPDPRDVELAKLRGQVKYLRAEIKTLIDMMQLDIAALQEILEVSTNGKPRRSTNSTAKVRTTDRPNPTEPSGPGWQIVLAKARQPVAGKQVVDRPDE